MHIWLKGFNGTWAAPSLTSYEYKMLSDGVYCTDPCRLQVTVQSLKRPVVISLYHSEEERYCGSCASVSVDGQPARLIRSTAARDLASSTITRWASEVIDSTGTFGYGGQATITIASPENILECPVCPDGCACTSQRVSLAGFSMEALTCSLFGTADCPAAHCTVKSGICEHS